MAKTLAEIKSAPDKLKVACLQMVLIGTYCMSH